MRTIPRLLPDAILQVQKLAKEQGLKISDFAAETLIWDGGLIEEDRADLFDEQANEALKKFGLKNPKSAKLNPDYTITLNKYHRSNLLWLLQAIGYPAGDNEEPAVEPFDQANTGDWVGEIATMLRCDLPLEHPPNKSLDELREDIKQWRKKSSNDS